MARNEGYRLVPTGPPACLLALSRNERNHRSALRARSGQGSEVDDWLPLTPCAASVAASWNSCSAIHISAAASLGNRRMDRFPLVEVTSTTKAANPSRTVCNRHASSMTRTKRDLLGRFLQLPDGRLPVSTVQNAPPDRLINGCGMGWKEMGSARAAGWERNYHTLTIPAFAALRIHRARGRLGQFLAETCRRCNGVPGRALTCGSLDEHRAPHPSPDQRSASQTSSDRRSVCASDQGALALSGGVLAASWSFNRCFSANVSAAKLFEKVARTCPLLSPSLTAKNAPSWVTTYVAISLVWHRSLQNYSASQWIDDRPFST